MNGPEVVTVLVVLDQSGVNAIRAAMERIMLDTNHCVKFRLKADYDVDYLHIFQGDG